eukprot:COSAG06_NODE_2799_length_6266_cov_19.296596_4_plen_871_part_00
MPGLEKQKLLERLEGAGWGAMGILKKAPEELRGDKEVALAAVAQSGGALQHASDELRGAKEVALAAVAQNGHALEVASDELRGDTQVALAAVAQSGYALQYASDELRGAKQVALVAVAQSGEALRYASAELRGDKDVALAAVAQTVVALRHVPIALQQADPVLKSLAQVLDSGTRRLAYQMVQRGPTSGFESTLPLLCHPNDAMQLVGACVAAACFASEEVLADPEPELDPATEANDQPPPEMEALKLSEAAETDLDVEPEPETSTEVAVDAEEDNDQEPVNEAWWEGDGEWRQRGGTVYVLETKSDGQPTLYNDRAQKSVWGTGTCSGKHIAIVGCEGDLTANGDVLSWDDGDEWTRVSRRPRPVQQYTKRSTRSVVLQRLAELLLTASVTVQQHAAKALTGAMRVVAEEDKAHFLRTIEQQRAEADLLATLSEDPPPHAERLLETVRRDMFARRQRQGWRLPEPDAEVAPGQQVFVEGLGTGEVLPDNDDDGGLVKRMDYDAIFAAIASDDLIQLSDLNRFLVHGEEGAAMSQLDADQLIVDFGGDAALGITRDAFGKLMQDSSISTLVLQIMTQVYTKIKFDPQEGDVTNVKLLRNSNGGKNWLLPPVASAETDWEANGAKDLDTARPRAARMEDVCVWMNGHDKSIVRMHAGLFGWTKLRKDDQSGVNGDELLRLSDHEKLTTRLHVVTESHRQALLDAIKPLAGYLWRYRMVDGPPVHLSRSAEAGYAQDELASPHQEVCVKRMKHWEQFKAEIDARFKDDGTPLSTDAVITVLRWHTPPGVSLEDRAGQTEEPQHTSKDDKHPYALVMARGQRSLHDACAKERIAGYDIETVIEVFRSILLCVLDLHNSGVCHADLKQRYANQQ